MISIELAVIITLVAITVGVVGTWLVMTTAARSRELARRITELEAEREQRNQILLDSRGRQRAHHAYNTLAAIEDATSLLLDICEDNNAERDRLQTALGILTTMREGPGAYKSGKHS